jgi:hypothetical protein
MRACEKAQPGRAEQVAPMAVWNEELGPCPRVAARRCRVKGDDPAFRGLLRRVLRRPGQPVAHCRASLWSKPLLPSDNRLAGGTTGGAAGRCGIFAGGATVVVRSTWDASALTDSLIQRRPQRSLPKSHFCNFPLLLNSGKCRKLAPNRADRARRPDAIESGAFKKVPSGRTLCLFLSCKALRSISARSMP